MNRHSDFRDRLLAAEQVDTKRRERYEMEMQRILNPRLSPIKRIVCGVVAAVSLLFAVNSAHLAIAFHDRGENALWGHLVFAIAAAFGLGFTVLAGRAAVTGTVNLRRDRPLVNGMAWSFSLFLAVLMMRASMATRSPYIGFVGLAFLVCGSLYAIGNLIEQSELRIRQKLLETELRLAETNQTPAGEQGAPVSERTNGTMRYFIAGNLWLLTSLVLLLAKKVERGEPTMYSFFGVGGWYYPGPYWLMVLACAGLGVAFLIIARRK